MFFTLKLKTKYSYKLKIDMALKLREIIGFYFTRCKVHLKNNNSQVLNDLITIQEHQITLIAILRGYLITVQLLQ